jgi:predicted Zn-ribbon and HTH transcriptional regulator
MTTIDNYIQDFSAMLGLAPSRAPESDDIGTQLGQAVGALIDKEADARAMVSPSDDCGLVYLSRGPLLTKTQCPRCKQWIEMGTICGCGLAG